MHNLVEKVSLLCILPLATSRLEELRRKQQIPINEMLSERCRFSEEK